MTATVDDDAPTPVRMIATCRTETPEPCPVLGVPFTVNVYPCAAPPTYRVQCIQCGQMVTDLVPA